MTLLHYVPITRHIVDAPIVCDDVYVNNVTYRNAEQGSNMNLQHVTWYPKFNVYSHLKLCEDVNAVKHL